MQIISNSKELPKGKFQHDMFEVHSTSYVLILLKMTLMTLKTEQKKF